MAVSFIFFTYLNLSTNVLVRAVAPLFLAVFVVSSTHGPLNVVQRSRGTLDAAAYESPRVASSLRRVPRRWRLQLLHRCGCSTPRLVEPTVRRGRLRHRSRGSRVSALRMNETPC